MVATFAAAVPFSSADAAQLQLQGRWAGR